MSRALGRAQSLLSLLHPGCVSAPAWLPAGVARLLSSVAPGLGGAGPLSGGGGAAPAAAVSAVELPASAWRDGTVEVPEFIRVRGMKDDLGLPAKDPRTVAFLVAKGFGTPDQVLSLLRSPGMFKTTLYRFETCVLVYELLERLAGGVTVSYKGQEVPLARAVISRQPCLLHSNVESLSSKWEALQAPQSAGGLGFSAVQAAKLVRNHPNVLKKRVEAIQARLTWLDALGLRDARAIITRQPTLIGLAVSSLEAKALILRHYGLDVPAVVSAMPSSLALANATLEPAPPGGRLTRGAGGGGQPEWGGLPLTLPRAGAVAGAAPGRHHAAAPGRPEKHAPQRGRLCAATGRAGGTAGAVQCGGVHRPRAQPPVPGLRGRDGGAAQPQGPAGDAAHASHRARASGVMMQCNAPFSVTRTCIHPPTRDLSLPSGVQMRVS